MWTQTVVRLQAFQAHCRLKQFSLLVAREKWYQTGQRMAILSHLQATTKTVRHFLQKGLQPLFKKQFLAKSFSLETFAHVSSVHTWANSRQ